jgi:predicted GH43/DUF377 family glycosyl hydrolase
MTVVTSLTHRVDAGLAPDPSRVVARLFLPGEEFPQSRSRAGAVVERVLALDEAEVSELADALLAEYDGRHRNYAAGLYRNAAMVRSHLRHPQQLTPARTLVLGAVFTAEYAVEGAALCNPSAVLHPDQRGLDAGQVRAAISLRAIGEGHLSSIGFATALIGPGAQWRFLPRQQPAVSGASGPAQWRRDHLEAVLVDQGSLDELAHSLLASLPDRFGGDVLQHSIEEHYDLLDRAGASATVALLRRLVGSAYEAHFPPEIELSQQVLLPSAADESHGMEDARFVRFVDADGAVDYRATYTAYDGRQIAPRLLTSPDLRSFSAHRLAGPAARNKGMALFPRLIDGHHFALCRSDGESTSLTSSADGLSWGDVEPIQVPTASWELLQVGNCGPPIETARGWLVLTHGVGPMRTYSMGALLLDLDDPAKVLGRLRRPLLQATAEERDGYVPNVVYSCGGLVHDGRLWVPYGVGDRRIAVAWAALDELLDELSG